MGSNRILAIAGVLLLLLLTATYANHFRNDFAFDDAHTVRNNIYIRDLTNIPRFFRDATTFSSNPSNQTYRPLMPTLFSLDYRLAGNRLDPFYFHLDSFVWYVLQLGLMFIFFLHLFDRAYAHRWNKAVALIATAFYGFHTANAETVNYLSARSDSLSTFWLIVAFVLYFKLPKTRWHGAGLFLVPIVIGSFVKQSVLVFPALLFFYALFFEDDENRDDLGFRRILAVGLKTALPSLLLCGLLYGLQAYMTPATFTPGGTSRFEYLITQPYVMLHYFENFLLPMWLVADTDWVPFQSVLSLKFFAGALFIALMLGAAWITHQKREWRPVAFGIIWFFVALLPTSSLIPFAEVINDHRTFFPYIGLVIALVWGIAFYLYREDARQPLQPIARRLILVMCAMVIGLHAAGAHARNEVWRDGESLWKDAVAKSRQSGRVWMNYGLALMARNDLSGAEQAYTKALELAPQYSYAHINMGILRAKQGKIRDADRYFQDALRLKPNHAEGYYFYARFLSENGRTEDAIANLEKNLQLSAAYVDSRYLLMSLYNKKGDLQKLHSLAEETLKLVPGDNVAGQYRLAQAVNTLDVAEYRADKEPTEDNFVNLSLEYTKARKYDLAMKAAEKAYSLNHRNVRALNNQCYANIMLGEFEAGEIACKKALLMDPNFKLVEGNLALRQRLKQESESYQKAIRNQPSTANYEALSLFYYREGMFQKSIESAQDALTEYPGDAEAHNIICAAHNNLGNYPDAIKVCEQAIALKPDFVLAKNNLKLARTMNSQAK
jgi:tetratricopeptide (TPR) repeat protein